MGSPPPPDAPSVENQQLVSAGLQETPPIADLCGLKIPGFAFSLSFALPDPGLAFAFPPSFALPFALRCDLDEPFPIVPGGGREGTPGLANDPEFGPDG